MKQRGTLAEAAEAYALKDQENLPEPGNKTGTQTSLVKTNPSNVFKDASQSRLNARPPSKFQPYLKPGTKRTSDGQVKSKDLAKALNNYSSFEDERTTHKTAVDIGQPDPFVIHEDDFSSDVDLDVEPARSVTYPELPTVIDLTGPTLLTTNARQVLSPGLPSPIVYPTLPRQQAVQTSYHDFDIPPPSSGAFDWSSSPPQHMQPKNATNTLSKPSPKPVADVVPSTTSTNRRIPWKDGEDSVKSKQIVVHDSVSTPATKKTKIPTSFHWNNTASVVKEQQKKHREEVREVRKALKKETTEGETLLAVKSTKKRLPRVFLSEEQQHVLNLAVENRDSVFFTGSAGTGKSVLLREIIASLRKKFPKEQDRVAITASTGLAACNIGGVTLHSFSGVGLGKEDAFDLVKKIKRNQKAKHRWMRTKVLVIDEISMVDGEFFDKLETIARQIRNNGRPFGGIQLVITGDFFQLPPVPDFKRAATFAFDASTWSNTIKHTIALHQVFRQKDPIFAGMLNEMREGKLSQASIQAFQSLSRDLNFSDNVHATELFPMRAEVERANTERLKELEGQEHVFEARDGGSLEDKVLRDRLLNSCMAPEKITLKKGAQVMLIKNVDEHLVNGSIGNVIAFMDEAQFDKFNTNEDIFGQQEDGILAAEAQESKEDKARRHLSDNLTISRKFPLVRFIRADGSIRDLLCQPETWKVEQPNGEVQASRSQIPLILSWALSIHKAQGQTLDRVKVNLSKAFEKGQAYVALSRATSMAGLQVLGFHPSKVMAHDKVINFYSNLARYELQDDKSFPKKTEPMKNATEYERKFLQDQIELQDGKAFPKRTEPKKNASVYERRVLEDIINV